MKRKTRFVYWLGHWAILASSLVGIITFCFWDNLPWGYKLMGWLDDCSYESFPLSEDEVEMGEKK